MAMQKKVVNFNQEETTIKHKDNVYIFPKNNLKSSNTSNNKKKGKKSEVFHLEPEDIKKIISYFEENEQWLYYMLFILGCNMARRVNDMLSLTWENFYFPDTGTMRNDILEIEEQKTDKLANPRINSACRKAIETYIEKTGCDCSKNNYTEPICMQLSGNYKGHVLSDSAYYKNIKKAAKKLGIKYNIGTHSPRKTFGRMSRMLHPNDPDSMELLRTIFNHSDVKTTSRYIGLTKEKIDAYYDDMGIFFNEYMVGDKEYEESKFPVITLNANDLKDIIVFTYESGKKNADNPDSMIHAEAIIEVMKMIEDIKK